MVFSAKTLANTFVENNSVLQSKKVVSLEECILEFNDTMHKIDVDNKIAHYKHLMESANGVPDNVLQESIVGSIKELLTRAIQAVIDFIKKFVGAVKSKFNKEEAKNFKRDRFEFGARARSNPEAANTPRPLTIFKHPAYDNVDDQHCRAGITTLVHHINVLCTGGELGERVSGDEYLGIAFSALAKSVKKNATRQNYSEKVRSLDAFKEFVSSNVIYTETLEMSLYEWHDKFYKNRNFFTPDIVAKKCAGMQGDLERCQDLVAKSNDISPSAREDANKIIVQLKQIVDAWIWYINALNSADHQMMNYYCKICGSSFKRRSNVRESGTIHGELFNGDTLFANDDIRDFNRTEWLDLELTTGLYEMSYESNELRRVIAVNEAMILSDDNTDKIQRLIAMREAEEAKFKDKFMAIIKQITAAIDKFFSSIKDKLSGDVKLINDNMEHINKPFKIQSVDTPGDLLAGLKRISAKTTLKPFDPVAMKEDLKDEKTFFEKHILPSLNVPGGKRQLKFDSNMSITDYCKAYFGASMDEKTYGKCTFTGKELESARNDIVKFLQAPNSVISSIRAEVKTLEGESRKATPAAAKATDTNAGTNSETKALPEANETKTESYYSELYGRWITEADIKMEEPQPGDTTFAEGRSKSQDNGFKVYLNAYKDVLLSKLTGASFLRSELMAIIRKQIETYNPAAIKTKKTEEQKAEQPAAQAEGQK